MSSACVAVPTSPDVAIYYGLKKGWCWTVITPPGINDGGEPAPSTESRARERLVEFRHFIPDASLAKLTEHGAADGSYWTWEPVDD